MIHEIFCVAVAVAVVSFSFSFPLVLFVLSVVIRNICFDCEMLMSEITSTASIKWVLTLCLLPESFYLKASVKQLLALSLCKHYENTVVRSSFIQTLKQGSHSLEKSLNSIFPWKVLKCLCKSLKSPWIFFNLKFSGLESVFWCFWSKTTEQWPN